MKITLILLLFMTLDLTLVPFRTYADRSSSKSNFLDVFLKWKLDAVQRQMKERLRLGEQLRAIEKQRQKLQHNFIDLNAGGRNGQEVVTQFRYQVDLDRDGEMGLEWDIDPTKEEVMFRLKARAHFTDVLALGFSAYGESGNADFLLMWTDLNGNHYFTDSHTDPDGYLAVDSSQDYNFIDVQVDSGWITFTFSRKYDTCDNEDYIVDTGTTHILFFSLDKQLEDLTQLNVGQLHPGLQRVQLLKSQIADEPLPDDTKTFVMRVENVKLPTQETMYWCHVRKLPPMKAKHQIIKFEGMVSEAGQGIVHHMEVFHCDGPISTSVRNYNGPCIVMGAERPKGLESCRQVIGAWAMGATPMSYPTEAGYTIGGENFSPYVMVEVHYNNPGLRSGVVDSSGIKFYVTQQLYLYDAGITGWNSNSWWTAFRHKYGVVDSSGIKFYVTQQLRPYDAGIMELGLEYTDKYALPPRLPLWNLQGYCIPECTSVGLREGGIHVFASQLHTHLTGKRAYTKHYRNGMELPELNRDNHYSPHYQEIRKLQRQVTVLPGDSLVTTCEDSTLDRDNVTLGGFSISDEMCVNYIHYYPKVQLEVCKSSVTTQSLYGFFNFLKEFQWEPTSPHQGISHNYHSITWSPMNIELLHTYYNIAPLSMQCNQSDGSRFPGVEWENKPIPAILKPLPTEERPCLV